MALPASGQITLNQVNVELGLSGTAQIGMNDSAVRSLFGVASGQIKMSDGYGASSEYVLSGNHQQITVSSYISSGGTLRINGGWIWSDNTSTAGLTIDIPCTIINEGKIIGKGGRGGGYNINTNGYDGGAAINVTSTGVTITNSSGAYIAGGGGGGGRLNANPPAGGGGGAGGGQGGPGSGDSGGAGGAIGATGAIPGPGYAYTSATAAGAGGVGGSINFNNNQGFAGAGGGRILPGTGGTDSTIANAWAGGAGGSGNSAGTNGTFGAGGGGGWGAAGGSRSGTGGAGGAAITGTARTLSNSGTIYGST